MAQSDDERRQWSRWQARKADARFRLDAERVARSLEQLQRPDGARRPWRVWTAVAVTAAILFAIPNPRFEPSRISAACLLRVLPVSITPDGR